MWGFGELLRSKMAILYFLNHHVLWTHLFWFQQCHKNRVGLYYQPDPTYIFHWPLVHTTDNNFSPKRGHLASHVARDLRDLPRLIYSIRPRFHRTFPSSRPTASLLFCGSIFAPLCRVRWLVNGPFIRRFRPKELKEAIEREGLNGHERGGQTATRSMTTTVALPIGDRKQTFVVGGSASQFESVRYCHCKFLRPSEREIG